MCPETSTNKPRRLASVIVRPQVETPREEHSEEEVTVSIDTDSEFDVEEHLDEASAPVRRDVISDGFIECLLPHSRRAVRRTLRIPYHIPDHGRRLRIESPDGRYTLRWNEEKSFQDLKLSPAYIFYSKFGVPKHCLT